MVKTPDQQHKCAFISVCITGILYTGDHDVLICLQTHNAGHLQPAVRANGCWQRLYEENGSWTGALTESSGTLVTT